MSLVCIILRTQAQIWELCRGADYAAEVGHRTWLLDAELEDIVGG